MIKNRFIIAAIVVFAAILAGCGAITPAAHTRITQDEAIYIIANQDAIILDVRELHEFNAGHIPNAISLPVDDIVDAVMHMIPNKEQIILVYCRSGNRSDTAAAILADMGYRNVYDFGGILSWTGEIIH